MSLDAALLAGPARTSERRRALWRGLLGTKTNAVITLAVVLLLAWILPPLVRWAVLDATWRGTAESCAAGSGACWAFIGEKLRFILFAFYPTDILWRPALAILAIAALLVATGMPRFWSAWLIPAWIVVLALVWTLLDGGLLGARVPTDQWGGLPLTLLIAVGCFAAAFPLAILLALARRSRLAIVRGLAVAYIEVMRGVPMIAVLYVAMLLYPMMLPADLPLDKLTRVLIAITLFVAAYLAEVIRAGLQALPAGQTEAAASLGLTWRDATLLIVLPQALRAVIPALVNLAIGILLNTSLVAVVGFLDLLNASKTAAADPKWLGFYDESYLFVAGIYFALSFGASQYSLWLQRRLATDHRMPRRGG